MLSYRVAMQLALSRRGDDVARDEIVVAGPQQVRKRVGDGASLKVVFLVA
jgi:hypothetical protein